ncbi:MAG: DUF6452 family protein [Leeuwenhoekiella sp.]
MKKSLFYIVFACTAITAALFSCERDDICAESTPTTPQLVVSFADIDLNDKRTTVNVYNPELSSDTLRFVNETEILIPLRTDTTVTVLFLRKNPGATNTALEDPDNEDALTFSYIGNEVFISRACGYRIVYDSLETGLDGGNDGRWIQDIIIERNQIVDQDTTHIRILH